MNDERERREKALFEEAFELADAERAAFLAARCAGDAELRARVEALLAAAARDDAFLSEPPPPLIELDGGERPGDRVGPYVLLERLGEGGFGAVFLAEQREPVQRRVALKVVKLGMDTRAVVARFEHERQLLTLMDHPHIARVLDAGVTPAGRPYFAMEHVPGRPITEHCDRRALDVDARLELFLQVCAAVQHAHTKGVLHRDLKASNVLVALRDSEPVVKVIDFGIAKVLAGGAAPAVDLTEEHQLVGTLGAMSPEQAAGSRDIDTRADVYSLGVLLYQLLVGSLPLEDERLRGLPPSEALRLVRELDPPAPSARLAQRTAQLPQLAAQRGTSPERLRARLRDELDWIVARALEKERERRYPSVEALRADLERHLRGEAVEAAPPSTSYRLRKALRRHRGAVLAAALVALALSLGTAGTALGWRRASSARDEALRQSQVASATLALLTRDLLAGVDPGAEGGRPDVTVREMLDRAVERLDSGASLRGVDAAARETVEHAVRCAAARSYRALGLYEPAFEQANAALERAELPGARAAALFELGEVHRLRRERPAAEAALTEALELRGAGGARSIDWAEAASSLAGLLIDRARLNEAETLMLEVLAIHRAAFGERGAETAQSMGNLAQVRMRLERPAEAIELLEGAHEIHRELLGDGHAQTVRDLFNLGAAWAFAGALPEAERCTREALTQVLALYGEGHPVVAMCRRNLATFLLAQGRAAEAAPLARAALEAERRASGRSRTMLSSSLSYLGRALLALGEHAEAELVLTEFVEVREAIHATERSAWRVYEARALLAQARLGLVREELARSGSQSSELERAAATLRALEPALVEAFDAVAAHPEGELRFLTEAESRRCVAAARLVALYEAWSPIEERGGGGAGAELTRWQARLAELRAQDAGARLVGQ